MFRVVAAGLAAFLIVVVMLQFQHEPRQGPTSFSQGREIRDVGGSAPGKGWVKSPFSAAPSATVAGSAATQSEPLPDRASPSLASGPTAGSPVGSPKERRATGCEVRTNSRGGRDRNDTALERSRSPLSPLGFRAIRLPSSGLSVDG